MAKEWRTLKLEILAETKQFLDDLKKSEKQTQSFGDKMAEFGKKAALAMAAFGAAAVTAGVQFAKAAAEDQQAANRLADTLKAVTGATNTQIAAVEKYITATSLATGITDDQLRPSFERLARSTKSVNEAQDLLNLSLDLAAATGKPLEAVTNSLAKAYDGNYTSLNRLGLGIDQGLIKAKDFDSIYRQLNTTFGEFSENKSEQAIVKFQRLQVALQEAKEQIGAALLPLFVKLGDWLIKTGVPNLQAFIDGLTGQKGVTVAIDNANEGAYEFGERLKKIFTTVYNLKEELGALSIILGSIWAAGKIAAFVSAIVSLVKAFQAVRAAAAVAGVAAAFATAGTSAAAGAIGAATVTAGILGAIALFGDSGAPGDVSAGLGNRPLGAFTGGGAGAITGGSSGFGGAIGATAGTGPQATGAAPTKSNFYTQFDNLKGVPIIDALMELDKGLKQTNRQLESGAISPYVAQQRLDQFMAARDELVGQSQAYKQGITINVNSPSIIDETGFTRAVVDALNSVERRQGGGASALVGL